MPAQQHTGSSRALPRHVVLIPDGNGRWALQHGKPAAAGHLQGARSVEGFLKACRKLQIPVATVWAFSTENWGREGVEVKAIMRLVDFYLRRNRARFRKEQMRFRHLGRRDRLAERYPRLMELIRMLEEETRDYRRYTLNLALDYGGRDEVLRAVRRLVGESERPEAVTWERLRESLDTADQPDVDLIIRTSGEHRLSGILPLQSIYAELLFIPRLLPELSEKDFTEALLGFTNRDRRFGLRPDGPAEPVVGE
ncbi:MAG: di-trans,poly-cis-decaprenylcistransferase [Candidatus Eisenbacteria sp.]|nr:di-trans,poly-cis-decaprenylcistransferase [Candidatus Eisenbacteria bacterium]